MAVVPLSRLLLGVLKWGGLATCVLAVAAWGFARLYVCWWLSPGRVGLAVLRYALTVGFGGAVFGSPGWEIWDAGVMGPVVEWWPGVERQRGGLIVTVPFWLMLAAALPVTGWAAIRGRPRVQPGHCACGYNLAGNVSGRCPECGAAVGVV